MPELPEVETIARSLCNESRTGFSILGQTIQDATVLWNRSIAVPDVKEFKQHICGQVIQEVGRRGKYIVMSLSADTLLFHLRMSGDLYLKPKAAQGEEPGKHDRVILTLGNGTRLIFEDARKFGRVWLLADPQQELGDLGPEPLSEALTVDQFFQMLQKSKRQLKPLLMDQTFMAGLGNIYTDESLFKARLHPLCISSELNRAQTEALLHAIRETLREGIQKNGASIDWVYRGGDFQNHFNVYGREGEPCPVCGTPVERIVVGQRGTHFCPVCQKRNPHA